MRTIRIFYSIYIDQCAQNEPFITNQRTSSLRTNHVSQLPTLFLSESRSQFTLRCIKSPRDRSFRYVIDRQKFLLDARSVIACTFYPMNSNVLSPRSITGNSFFDDLTRSTTMYVLGGCVCQWLKHALIKYIGLK